MSNPAHVSETQQSEPVVTPYDAIGGADGVRRLVDRFYDLMETEPAAAAIRAMHAADLGPMRDRLFAFMSGWMGGPRLYKDCVMSAHRPFSIGAEERDQWMACMKRALAESTLNLGVREKVEEALYGAADFIRNR